MTPRRGPARMLADAVPEPYWLDRPARPAARSRLVEPIEADLVVVGGGFTGLWAAVQAAEERPGRSVVLLEAVGFAVVRPHPITPRLRMDLQSTLRWPDFGAAWHRLAGLVSSPATPEPASYAHRKS